MDKFWKWQDALPVETETEKKPDGSDAQPQESTLFLHGTIAEESWFDDDITPQMFRDELEAHQGDITVYINSPGGDCVAASEIYTMLMEHKGNVTVKIDGMAASAASVIAMAGTKVLMAPTSLMMIHNPATMAFGDHNDLKAAEKMLGEVKDSIIKAYDLRTGLGYKKISDMMEAETWMSADYAVSLGFADGIITRTDSEKREEEEPQNYSFSRKSTENSLYRKLVARYGTHGKEEKTDQVPADELYRSLNRSLLIKSFGGNI